MPKVSKIISLNIILWYVSLLMSIGHEPKIYLRGVIPYTPTRWLQPPPSSMRRVGFLWIFLVVLALLMFLWESHSILAFSWFGSCNFECVVPSQFGSLILSLSLHLSHLFLHTSPLYTLWGCCLGTCGPESVYNRYSDIRPDNPAQV